MNSKLVSNLVIGGALAALLHVWVLCREIPAQAVPRSKPKARAIVKVCPEEQAVKPGGFEKVAESGGARMRGQRVEADQPKGEAGAVSRIPLSIEWPTEGTALPEICDKFGLVLVEMGTNGIPRGRIDPAKLAGPSSPWTGSSVAMSNRVRTLPSIGGAGSDRDVRVLVPAEFDRRIIERQTAAATALGMPAEAIRRQVGKFSKDEQGNWDFMICETDVREEGTQ